MTKYFWWSPGVFIVLLYHPTYTQEIFAYGIQNLRNSSCGMENPGLWNPEYSSRNPESHLRLESRIQVPLTKTGIQCVESGIQDEESRTQARLSWIPLYQASCTSPQTNQKQRNLQIVFFTSCFTSLIFQL